VKEEMHNRINVNMLKTCIKTLGSIQDRVHNFKLFFGRVLKKINNFLKTKQTNWGVPDTKTLMV
jgi:hypothetical protein